MRELYLSEKDAKLLERILKLYRSGCDKVAAEEPDTKEYVEKQKQQLDKLLARLHRNE